MNNFGLVIATNIEKEAALNNFKDLDLIESYPFLIYKTLLNNNKSLYIIISGVGNTLSSIATTYLLNRYDINYIFNYGVVGAVNKNINLSDIVLINEVIDFDFDTDPIDHKGKGYHEELVKYQLKSDINLLNLAQKITSLPILKLGCSNKFIDKKEVKENIFEEFKVDVVDMESFGFLVSSKLFNTPCLILKGVSDAFLDGSTSYLVKASEVATKTFKILLKIFEEL